MLFNCGRLASGVCLLAGIMTTPSMAAEWSVEPSVAVREEYNDNFRFTSDPHNSVWATSLSPKVKFGSKTEVSEVSGSAQLNINRYAGDHLVKDSTDRLFNLISNFIDERNSWGMNASYTRDSTASSERLATGVIQALTQRTLFNLTPSWTRTLTEKESLKLSYIFENVKYDEHINLNDYIHRQADVSLIHQLSEVDQASLSMTYSLTDYASSFTQFPFQNPFFFGGTDTSTIAFTTRAVQADVTHRFSETLRGTLSLGYRDTDTSIRHSCNGILGAVSYTNIVSCTGFNGDPIITFTNETKGNGSTFNATIEKQFENAKISSMASREVIASGGGPIENDRLGVSLNNGLTETLTGFFDANIYRTTYIGTTVPGSRYYTFEPRLNWRYTEWLTLDTGFRSSRYKPDNANTATTSNVVYMNLSYDWPKISVSR